MYAQCDIEGNQYRLMDHIVDHRKDNNAVSKDNQNVTANGKSHKQKTTRGWQLCIEWKDKSTSWERLSDMKESYPVQVAEYAETVGISDEPAFSWWTAHVLKKTQRMIASFNKRYHKVTHTFKILDEDERPPISSQYMKCHMVFSIKMEDFSQKACLVAGGHMVKAPMSFTYASMVSRELVRIALTLAALNDLAVKTSDILNASLTAPCSEKVHTTLGTEFGEHKGKTAFIVRAFYGLAYQVQASATILQIACATLATNLV